MKIPIIFLGTGQAIPTAKRNHTAVLLQYKNENILIDCGEGTQRQFRKARLNPCKLTRILITHWHGDHILGLPGLLQTLALNNYNKTLYVYGPKGTKKFFSLILNMFVFVGKLKVEIQEVQGKFLETSKSKDFDSHQKQKVFETKDFYIEAMPMKHNTYCNAYSFIEKDKLRIDKSKLKKFNLPSSPLIKSLQLGKEILWKGKKIKASQLTYKEKGKKITFILDTALNENCFKITKNSDLLVCEAVYSKAEKDKAKEYLHLTAEQAAEIAKKSKTKKLILTHLSQRYEKSEKELLKEARKIFKNTTIAEDFGEIEI